MSHAVEYQSPRPNRRERNRAATVAEIKELAWFQLAEVGAAALSLRGIAGDMGMTSSALYRYFASREDLLTALVVDAFSSLADALERAEKELAEDPDTDEWLHLARTHRRWALEHPTEYTLMYGSPIPGFQSGSEECHVQMKRGVFVLFRCMMKALSTGEFDESPWDATMTPELRRQLASWRDEIGVDLPPAALAGCLFAWTQLHGSVQLELFGHLPTYVTPADELFDQHMHQVLRVLGLGS